MDPVAHTGDYLGIICPILRCICLNVKEKYRYSDVALSSWRLKSPLIRLFLQQLIGANNKENIKTFRYSPFVRGIHRPPSQRDSNA